MVALILCKRLKCGALKFWDNIKKASVHIIISDDERTCEGWWLYALVAEAILARWRPLKSDVRRCVLAYLSPMSSFDKLHKPEHWALSGLQVKDVPKMLSPL